jgi:hypothetical protein
MGWNDSRIPLLAPGWKYTASGSSNSRTAEGTQVSVLDIERAEDTATMGIDAAKLIVWLQERGFKLHQQSDSYARLAREDIEAFLAIEGAELGELILTFSLSKESPNKLEAWQGLVDQICNAWGLKPYDLYLGSVVDSTQFLRLLTNTSAWRDFGLYFGWEEKGSGLN